MSPDAFDDPSSVSSSPWASSSEEATSDEDAGEGSDAPLHVSRKATWFRCAMFVGGLTLPGVMLYAEYYNTPPYHEISWSLLFIGAILLTSGLGFVGWYITQTYQVRVYPDRIEQRSYLWPGMKNPAPSWEGFYTLYYEDLGRVRIPGDISSMINFYRWEASTTALSIPKNGVSEPKVLIGTLLEVFPDHVEVSGRDKIIRYYRGERELAWWEF